MKYFLWAVLSSLCLWQAVAGAADQKAVKIILLAGTVMEFDKPGHHDYLGGCKLFAKLLEQTSGVETVLVEQGWPKDEKVFEGAKSVVFYTDGGGKQAYLKTPERIVRIQKMVDAGVGIVSFHQAVDYPGKLTKQATSWIGGTYLRTKSDRGHWVSDHKTFPTHPITRGVKPWKVADGWLNKLQFAADMKGVTPLVWSGKKGKGSDVDGEAGVVGWAYERSGGGRSFSYSGIDMHQFLKLAGMRQIITNGILWSAGVEIPSTGAPAAATDEQIDALMTPRKSKQKKKASAVKPGRKFPPIKTVSRDLTVPALVDASPAPGKRVKVFAAEYKGTKVFHTLYLPTDWKKGGQYPVIMEYAGNSRTAEGCSLGYGISGGQGVIWVCLPYVHKDHKQQQNKWWGDVDATVRYCKETVASVCKEYGGDSKAVFLTGFSRGAIACNFLGLHDDEMASLWAGIIAHSHYDGLIRWSYPGSDKAQATQRLQRLKATPQFISNEHSAKANGMSVEKTRSFVQKAYPSGNYTFQPLAFYDHTDEWVLRDVPSRKAVRKWFAGVVSTIH
jgi:hypothetical protein